MSGRRVLRVSKGVTNTNADPAACSHRSGTPSAQLTARLRSRMGGPLPGSSSTPSLGHGQPIQKQREFRGSPNQRDGKATRDEGESPLPLLNGQHGGVPPRPSTTAGALGRPSTNAGFLKMEGSGEGRIFTPPRSSPGLSRREAGLVNGNRASSGSRCSRSSSGANGKGRTSPSVQPLSPGTQTTAEGSEGGKGGSGGRGGGGGADNFGCKITQDVVDDGNAEIPLGLHKLSRDDLEVYVHVVRTALARQARRKQAAPLNSVGIQSTVSTTTPFDETRQSGGGGGGGRGADGGPISDHGERERLTRGGVARGVPRRKTSTGSRGDRGSASTLDMNTAMCSPGGRKNQVDRGQNVRRKHRLRGHHHHHHYHHHHHHHHQQLQQQQREKRRASGGGLIIPPSSTQGGSDRGGLSDSHSGTALDGDRSWYARSKGSKTVPLRTLMLDPEVNNIPQVNTQSDFRALIKSQNIPHPSYDIDGDGIVSQEDYALAKRFDYNGDGILDEAEMFVGRRIMAEIFLEKHKHDLHLYGNGLAQKSMAANVGDISRSHGFKKVINGLREKEKNFAQRGSNDVRDCVTLKPESLTRHNFFSDKFDTTAWNDFTRDPRDAGWLESRAHDGSRNQMHFMRKIEARESAQNKLNAGYPGGDAFSTRRVKLITDPAVENS